MDTFKRYKSLGASWPNANDLSRTGFAAMFLAFRSAYWPVVSWAFWKASLAADSAIDSMGCVYGMCIGNACMTLLQGCVVVVVFLVGLFFRLSTTLVVRGIINLL